MKKYRVIICCSIIIIWVCSFSLLHAAEVHYLGADRPAAETQPNPSYSLSQRFHDLFDFSSGRGYEDRSGRLSGNFTEEISWQNIGGNKSKSFLEEGVDYLAELNLNIQERLWSNYNFEGQSFLRKTDNRRIETKQELRLKQFNLKVYNPQNLFEFGDFYADFSPFVLGSSLEGLNIGLSSDAGNKYKAVFARSTRADEAADKFQRNVLGAKADYLFFEDSDIFSNFRLGVQVATVQDDSSTIERTSSTRDLKNTVTSIDGEIALRNNLSLNYELGRSSHLEDADSESVRDTAFGTALRVQPALSMGKSNFRYLYYYVQPEFYSEVGSAAPDKIQHQLTWDYRLTPKAIFSFTENYHWDRLEGSTKTKRTYNDEKYLNLTLRPFASRKDFTFRPYINHLRKDSDDATNSVESTTRTSGFSVNDTLNPRTTYGFNYEYRGFSDEANKTSSDYFHRLGLNLGREEKLLGRRLYFSLNAATDARTTKRDENKDLNLGLSLNGQYDVLEKGCVMRFGHNLQNANGASPASDSVNNRSFLEFDFLLAEKRATRFIIRGERNHYNHEDGTQDYSETRAITKFVSNF